MKKKLTPPIEERSSSSMINLTPLEESTQFFEDILHRPIIHSIFNSIKDIHGLTTSQKEDVIHSIYKAHLSGPISFYSPLWNSIIL